MLVIGLAGLLGATLLTGRPPARALGAFSGKDGRLAAVQGKVDAGLPCGSSGHNDCGYDDSLITFRADGAGQRVVRRHVTSDQYDRIGGSTWAPGGRRLAFLSGLGPATIRADGTHHRALRPTCCFYSIAWAADGQHLLLGGSATETANDGIYELRLENSSLHRLTHGADSDPVASSTGAIAFERDVHGSPWIYVIRHAGSKPRRFLRGSDPDWSPHGKMLAFARGDDIYVVRAGGGPIRRLTKGIHTSDQPREPAWSPRGTRIVFVRYPNLYVVRVRGRHVHRVRLTKDQNLFWASPSWQPVVK